MLQIKIKKQENKLILSDLSKLCYFVISITHAVLRDVLGVSECWTFSFVNMNMYHCINGLAFRMRDFWISFFIFLVFLLHRKYDGQSRFVAVRILWPRYINPITYAKKSQMDFYSKTQSRITCTPYCPVYFSSSVYC